MPLPPVPRSRRYRGRAAAVSRPRSGLSETLTRATSRSGTGSAVARCTWTAPRPRLPRRLARARSMSRSGGGAVRRERHPMRGDRQWAQRGAARGGGDGAGGCARSRHVRGRGGPSSLRRAPRLHQVSQRKGLERVLQVGVRQAHDLPPRSGLHARLRQRGDRWRHAATPARLSLSDPVLAKRAGRHLCESPLVRPPPRRDPLLRHGVGAHPRKAPFALDGLRVGGLASGGLANRLADRTSSSTRVGRRRPPRSDLRWMRERIVTKRGHYAMGDDACLRLGTPCSKGQRGLGRSGHGDRGARRPLCAESGRRS
jgi:hypothetical protein